MVLETDFSNAFAIDGIVPDKYGMRTVVEYRSRLFSIPTRSAGLPTRDQVGDEDVDMIAPIVSQDRGEAGAAPRLADGNLPLPEVAESEHALRHLGNLLDLSGMGSLEPKYLAVLRVDRPMSLGGRTRPVLIEPTSTDEGDGFLASLRSVASSLLSAPKRIRETELSLLSWHWAEDLVAVATGAHLDRICAYNFRTNRWETLPQRIESLNGTRCIAFRPFAGRALAVGCEAGVALFKGPQLNFLKSPGHKNIASLDWSPDGSKLATASAADGTVRLWDIGTNESIFVDKGGLVRFSRGAGRHLFVASAIGSFFRLWNYDTWKNERWGHLSGPVTAVTWSPDGMTLLFSTHGESAIHVISIGVPGADDDTRVVHTELTGLPLEGPGGTPILLEMDDTGERLAVAFEIPPDEVEEGGIGIEENIDEKRRFAVGLYATQLAPNFQISPIGYVSGPERSGPPVALKFKPKDERNLPTILSCMWRSGDVSFTQLLFNPLR